MGKMEIWNKRIEEPINKIKKEKSEGANERKYQRMIMWL